MHYIISTSKSNLAAKLGVSTPVASFYSFLVEQFEKSNTSLNLSLI